MCCKQLTLPVQGCFNRCFAGARNLVHTLKSNNLDQFNHKAVAREGNQSFPLWLQPTTGPKLQSYTLLFTFWACVCVSAWWLHGIGALCSFLFCHEQGHRLSGFLSWQLIHTHMEVSGQSAAKATSCSLEAISFECYFSGAVMKQSVKRYC